MHARVHPVQPTCTRKRWDTAALAGTVGSIYNNRCAIAWYMNTRAYIRHVNPI